jgi:hypothetical protein
VLGSHSQRLPGIARQVVPDVVADFWAHPKQGLEPLIIVVNLIMINQVQKIRRDVGAMCNVLSCNEELGSNQHDGRLQGRAASGRSFWLVGEVMRSELPFPHSPKCEIMEH